MKFLAVIIFAALAIASAVPVPSYYDDSLTDEISEDFLVDWLRSEILKAETDDHTKEEPEFGGKELRKTLDEIFEKIKETVKEGKLVSKETIHKVKQILHRLKELKVDVSNQAKEIFHYLKEQAKDYFRKLLDKLQIDNGVQYAEKGDDELKTELGKQLKEALDQILEKIRDAVDQGKVIKEDTIAKMKEIREKLRELKVDLGQKARDLLESIKNKGKEYLRKLLDKLKIEKRDLEYDFEEAYADDSDDSKSELERRLRKHMENMLEKIKDAVEKGKGVRDDLVEKVKKLRQKMKDMRIDLGNKANELVKKLKEKSSEYLQKLLERLGLNKDEEEVFYSDEEEDEEMKREMEKNLNEHFQDVLEKVKDAIEHGKTIKEETIERLKELRGKMKDLNMELDKKSKVLVNKIKEKGKDYYKKFLERLGVGYGVVLQQSEAYMGEDKDNVADDLRNQLDDILQKIKDAIEHGKSVKEAIKKLQEIGQKLQKMKEDVGNKARELLEKIKEKAKEHWNRFLDKLKPEKRSVSQSDTLKEIFRKLKKLVKDKIKEKYNPEELKAKIEQLFGKGSEFADTLLQMLKEKGEKGKNKILEMIDRILGDDKEQRAVSDTFKKVKDYFRKLKLDLEDKFVKFGEYVKTQFEKGIEIGKTKGDNLKKIAIQIMKDTENVSQEIAREALEFFKVYKAEMGTVYDDFEREVKKIHNIANE